MAVSTFDGCIYSLPFSFGAVHKMLKIDPIAGTAKQVGEDLRNFAGGATSWSWHGVVAGADGCIYGMPHNAASVLRYDPRTGKLSTLGKLGDSPKKYSNGVLGPAGRFIFGIPHSASRVLCIDTEKLTVQLIGQEFGGNDNWYGGGIGGDMCIYCIPWKHTHVLRIDPVTMTTSLFGPKLRGDLAWVGGCAGLDGCVYGTPHASDRVLRIDPLSGTVSMVDKPVPKELCEKLAGAVVASDGNIWFLPHHLPAKMLRLKPPSVGHPALLADLLRPEQHTLLREGLSDVRRYGLALVGELWREAKSRDRDPARVSRLLDIAAPVLPETILKSIREDGGRTARVLLETILVCVKQVCC